MPGWVGACRPITICDMKISHEDTNALGRILVNRQGLYDLRFVERDLATSPTAKYHPALDFHIIVLPVPRESTLPRAAIADLFLFRVRLYRYLAS